jgi:hypothetical protein
MYWGCSSFPCTYYNSLQTPTLVSTYNNNVKIKFDIVVDTNHGWLYAIRLKRGASQFVGQFAGHYIVQ